MLERRAGQECPTRKVLLLDGFGFAVVLHGSGLLVQLVDVLIGNGASGMLAALCGC